MQKKLEKKQHYFKGGAVILPRSKIDLLYNTLMNKGLSSFDCRVLFAQYELAAIRKVSSNREQPFKYLLSLEQILSPKVNKQGQSYEAKPHRKFTLNASLNKLSNFDFANFSYGEERKIIPIPRLFCQAVAQGKLSKSYILVYLHHLLRRISKQDDHRLQGECYSRFKYKHLKLSSKTVSAAKRKLQDLGFIELETSPMFTIKEHGALHLDAPDLIPDWLRVRRQARQVREQAARLKRETREQQIASGILKPDHYKQPRKRSSWWKASYRQAMQMHKLNQVQRGQTYADKMLELPVSEQLVLWHSQQSLLKSKYPELHEKLRAKFAP